MVKLKILFCVCLLGVFILADIGNALSPNPCKTTLCEPGYYCEMQISKELGENSECLLIGVCVPNSQDHYTLDDPCYRMDCFGYCHSWFCNATVTSVSDCRICAGCFSVPEETTSAGETSGSEELCDGEICTPGQVCQEMYCTPYCPEGEPCPHDPCGKMCINAEEGTSTTRTPTATP